MTHLACLVLALAACEQASTVDRTQPAVAPPKTSAAPIARAKQLFDHPEWIDTVVTVDVVEPLYDFEHSSGADPGQYDVEVADVGAKRFKLVPAQGKLDTLHPPIRVRGKLEATEHGVQIVVDQVTPLPPAKPEHLARTADLTADPAKWSGKLVEVDDTWTVGFEASVLGDSGVWLDSYPDATMKCEPPPKKNAMIGDYPTYHVHVIGYAYTASGRYGHLGGAKAKIVATEIEFSDLCPKKP